MKVYPRVCGGSARLVSVLTCACGLSPRVRGKRVRVSPFSKSVRSIPACAGEARLACAGVMLNAVYPRVCGGSAVPASHRPQDAGLSPRVRGKPEPTARPLAYTRSIPACAGEA